MKKYIASMVSMIVVALLSGCGDMQQREEKMWEISAEEMSASKEQPSVQSGMKEVGKTKEVTVCDREATILYAGDQFTKSVFAVGADMLYVCGRKENGSTFWGRMQQEEDTFQEFVVNMEAGMRPFDMAVDERGNCHILWMSVESVEMNGESLDMINYEKSCITVVNPKGEADNRIDVSEVFSTIEKRPFCFAVDREGNYYVEKEKNVIKITKDGSMSENVVCDGWVEGIGVGKSGVVYCIYSDTSGCAKLARFDAGKPIVCEVQLPKTAAVYAGVYAGTDTELLLINKDSGIYACDEETVKQRVSVKEMPVSGEKMTAYGVLADGRACLMGQENQQTTFYYIAAGK